MQYQVLRKPVMISGMTYKMGERFPSDALPPRMAGMLVGQSRITAVEDGASNRQTQTKRPAASRLPEGVAHLGWGTYELPSGERVKGRDKMLAACKGGD